VIGTPARISYHLLSS